MAKKLSAAATAVGDRAVGCCREGVHVRVERWTTGVDGQLCAKLARVRVIGAIMPADPKIMPSADGSLGFVTP